MADDLIQYKPKQMAKATWDYLMKFTIHHEGIVNHLYHNYPPGSKFPDVSCGIGFLLQADKANSKTPAAATLKEWVKHFTNPDGSSPDEAQLKTEWEEAYKILRVSQPTNGEIAEFRAKCKLNLRPGIVKPKMAQLLVSKLNLELNRAPLKDVDFWNLPAVAQIAIASVSYGYSPTKMPNFTTALKAKDFNAAANQIQLPNMSGIKNYDHWLLMKDAEYIYQYHREDAAAMAYTPTSISRWITLSSQPSAMGLYGSSEQIMSE